MNKKKRVQYKNVDLTGMRFGKLTAIERVSEQGTIIWKFKCDCGNIVEREAYRIVNGCSKSCGCALSESQKRLVAESTKHGESKTRLYFTWEHMINRCYSEKNINYKNYGARGIKVCEEWRNSFLAFKRWAYENGYDENADRIAQSIDRIDVNGNYEPSNCRWANAKTQAENRRTTSLYDCFGQQITPSEFADLFGITDKSFVYRHLKKGDSYERIIKDWKIKENPPSDMMSRKEASNELKVSINKIKRLINCNKLDGKKIGNKWYVTRKSVKKFKEVKDG